MPNSILLFVPLLAGYWFQRIFYYTRFQAQSLDGYKLVLQSILIGVIFAAISRVAIVAIKLTLLGQFLWEVWTINFAHTEYSGTATLSILLAFVSPFILNMPVWDLWISAFHRKRIRLMIRHCWRRYCRWEEFRLHAFLWSPDAWKVLLARRSLAEGRALRWATRRQKNQLLLLLSEAALAKEMIVVSLKNRKFYIGYVKSVPSLNPFETFFGVYVMRSGYRDKDTLQFVETNDYNNFYLQAAAEYPKRRDMKVVSWLFVTLPMESVETAAVFDVDAYVRLLKLRPAINECGEIL